MSAQPRLWACARKFSIGALADTARLICWVRCRACPATASMIDVQFGHGEPIGSPSGPAVNMKL